MHALIVVSHPLASSLTHRVAQRWPKALPVTVAVIPPTLPISHAKASTLSLMSTITPRL